MIPAADDPVVTLRERARAGDDAAIGELLDRMRTGLIVTPGNHGKLDDMLDTKHLPGQHDQQRHAGGAGLGLATKVADAVAGGMETLARMYPDRPRSELGEAERNWSRNFRRRGVGISQTRPVLRAAIADGIAGAMESEAMQTAVERYGPVTVVPLRGDPMPHPRGKADLPAAEQQGPYIFVYDHGDDPMAEITDTPGQITPGAATTTGPGGYPAMIRHEYAHFIYHRNPELAQRFNAAYRETPERALTYYAGMSAGEGFSEAFAIGSDPGYDAELWDPGARALIELAMEAVA